MNKLAGWVISYVIKMDWLDGYRSYIAGAGFVVAGVGLIANQVASESYDEATFEKGIASILAGLAILGRAGKTDKLINTTKAPPSA